MDYVIKVSLLLLLNVVFSNLIFHLWEINIKELSPFNYILGYAILFVVVPCFHLILLFDFKG